MSQNEAEIVVGFFEWLRYHPDTPITYQEIANSLKVNEQFIYDITSGRRKKIPTVVGNRIKLVFGKEIVEYLKTSTDSETVITNMLVNIEKLGQSANQIVELLIVLMENQGMDTKNMKELLIESQVKNLYSVTRMELIEKITKEVKRQLK